MYNKLLEVIKLFPNYNNVVMHYTLASYFYCH